MRQGLHVAKMSGAGNDFIVVDARETRFSGALRTRWIRAVCRRGVSVGADGVLLVAPLGADRIEVRFFNPDGGAAFCGNGSRCAARFGAWRGWAGERMVLVTSIGEVPAIVRGRSVELRLPPPRDLGLLDLEIDSGERIRGRLIDAGVPHFVHEAPAIEDGLFHRFAPRVRHHPRLAPAGANFDLVQRGPADRLDIRTWERGVEAETLACGSAAVAAAFAARLEGGGARVRVIPASGIPLVVSLPGEPHAPRHAVLKGDARLILEGRLGTEATRR